MGWGEDISGRGRVGGEEVTVRRATYKANQLRRRILNLNDALEIIRFWTMLLF